MKKLSDILSEHQMSGVFRLEEAASIKELEELAKQFSYSFFLLEGTNIDGKERFLNHAAAALRFPDYFGGNWDAFEDCLTDMSWHESHGFVILYDHFETFAEHSPDQFKIALEILLDSANFWRDQRKPLFVLLRSDGRQALELPSISL
ncbi:MAG TPA: barstar family protein [Desulfomonilaceae bacterium]|nr:barstar family protein [Desulfomonilaceae bacterium]